VIPITIDEIKKITNLGKLRSDEVISSKMVNVDALMKGITRKKYYNRVVRGVACDVVKSAFYTAFSYFIYAEVIEFLNTNTRGEGIITSTGIDNVREGLLSEGDSYSRRNTLEFMAYKVIREYLNEAGTHRYHTLKLWDDLRRGGADGVRMSGSGTARGVLI
jgi:hypothetical protein